MGGTAWAKVGRLEEGVSLAGEMQAGLCEVLPRPLLQALFLLVLPTHPTPPTMGIECSEEVASER